MPERLLFFADRDPCWAFAPCGCGRIDLPGKLCVVKGLWSVVKCGQFVIQAGVKEVWKAEHRRESIQQFFLASYTTKGGWWKNVVGVWGDECGQSSIPAGVKE